MFPGSLLKEWREEREREPGDEAWACWACVLIKTFQQFMPAALVLVQADSACVRKLTQSQTNQIRLCVHIYLTVTT